MKTYTHAGCPQAPGAILGRPQERHPQPPDAMHLRFTPIVSRLAAGGKPLGGPQLAEERHVVQRHLDRLVKVRRRRLCRIPPTTVDMVQVRAYGARQLRRRSRLEIQRMRLDGWAVRIRHLCDV